MPYCSCLDVLQLSFYCLFLGVIFEQWLSHDSEKEGTHWNFQVKSLDEQIKEIDVKPLRSYHLPPKCSRRFFGKERGSRVLPWLRKCNSFVLSCAAYLRRDENVKSYNSEGNTDAFSSQATTKFIVGDPGDLGDDPDMATETENRSYYGEKGKVCFAQVFRFRCKDFNNRSFRMTFEFDISISSATSLLIWSCRWWL